MLVNTRHHQADFKVTRDDHMDALIEQLGRFGCGVGGARCLPVASTTGEENDNTEVAKVLAKVSRIQTELKCACALVHHIAKVDRTDIFKGLRGASAIHGWMEWGIGISVTNPEEEDRGQVHHDALSSRAKRRLQVRCSSRSSNHQTTQQCASSRRTEST